MLTQSFYEQIYEDQVHGFALRSDWSSEKDKEAMNNAESKGVHGLRSTLRKCVAPATNNRFPSRGFSNTAERLLKHVILTSYFRLLKL